MSKRQIIGAVLGRLPEDSKAAVEEEKFQPRPALAGKLNGAEFQSRIREIVLQAYPEKRRLIFVHVPKCAGTDLITGLRRRMPMLHWNLSSTNVTPRADFFAALRELAMTMPLADRIAVSGHVPLRWYQDRGLLRYGDDLFTVVREPRGIVYSYISFILTRLKNFAGVKRNDTTQWLSAIGMTDVGANPSDAFLVEVGSQLLRAPSVTSRNIICNNLDRGQAAGAIENAIVTGVEITDVSRYSAWKAQRFGLASEKRLNESLPLFTPESAPAADRDYIEDMVGEDTRVYTRIMAALARTEALSIRGEALA